MFIFKWKHLDLINHSLYVILVCLFGFSFPFFMESFVTSYHPRTSIQQHYLERLVSISYKYKQLIKITNPSQRGKVPSHIIEIKKHLLIRTVGKRNGLWKKVLGEINNICISYCFLNPTHKQFVVTALGWDYGILDKVWLQLKIDTCIEDQKRNIKQLKFCERLMLFHCNNFPKGTLVMLLNTDFNRL